MRSSSSSAVISHCVSSISLCVQGKIGHEGGWAPVNSLEGPPAECRSQLNPLKLSNSRTAHVVPPMWLRSTPATDSWTKQVLVSSRWVGSSPNRHLICVLQAHVDPLKLRLRGGVAQWLGRRSLAGRISPCPIHCWQITIVWVNCPQWVSQLGKLSLPSLRGR